MDWQKKVQLAEETVTQIILELPDPIRAQSQHIAITYRKRPGKGLIRDGVEPDTLGLYVGETHAGDDPECLPQQIILFLENIWECSEGNTQTFCEEIKTTFLHELGHFLGLDEVDLEARGLE